MLIDDPEFLKQIKQIIPTTKYNTFEKRWALSTKEERIAFKNGFKLAVNHAISNSSSDNRSCNPKINEFALGYVTCTAIGCILLLL